MKQLIVMAAMIALGLFIYGVIAGPGDNSVMASLSDVWRQGISVRTYSP